MGIARVGLMLVAFALGVCTNALVIQPPMRCSMGGLPIVGTFAVVCR